MSWTRSFRLNWQLFSIVVTTVAFAVSIIASDSSGLVELFLLLPLRMSCSDPGMKCTGHCADPWRIKILIVSSLWKIRQGVYRWMCYRGDLDRGVMMFYPFGQFYGRSDLPIWYISRFGAGRKGLVAQLVRAHP